MEGSRADAEAWFTVLPRLRRGEAGFAAFQIATVEVEETLGKAKEWLAAYPEYEAETMHVNMQ